jgi:hypothetical protein
LIHKSFVYDKNKVNKKYYPYYGEGSTPKENSPNSLPVSQAIFKAISFKRFWPSFTIGKDRYVAFFISLLPTFVTDNIRLDFV